MLNRLAALSRGQLYWLALLLGGIGAGGSGAVLPVCAGRMALCDLYTHSNLDRRFYSDFPNSSGCPENIACLAGVARANGSYDAGICRAQLPGAGSGARLGIWRL